MGSVARMHAYETTCKRENRREMEAEVDEPRECRNVIIEAQINSETILLIYIIRIWYLFIKTKSYCDITRVFIYVYMYISYILLCEKKNEFAMQRKSSKKKNNRRKKRTTKIQMHFCSCFFV